MGHRTLAQQKMGHERKKIENRCVNEFEFNFSKKKKKKIGSNSAPASFFKSYATLRVFFGTSLRSL